MKINLFHIPDYDQLLAKRPESEDAIFAWHQDMAYWPPLTADMATATCWLAVTPSTKENGCMRFVPASHKEAALRPHAPGRLPIFNHLLSHEITMMMLVIHSFLHHSLIHDLVQWVHHVKSLMRSARPSTRWQRAPSMSASAEGISRCTMCGRAVMWSQYAL